MRSDFALYWAAGPGHELTLLHLSDLSMPTYVKRYWNETRGDEYDAWGTSWWYFEVDSEGWVLRQIEQYDSGVRLTYSEQHEEDEFGMLAEKPLDLSDPEYSRISPQEFESLWAGNYSAVDQKLSVGF